MKTRKILLITLLLLACTMLSSCVLLFPFDSSENDKHSVFFDDELLSQKGIRDIPLPKLEGSVMRADVLYLSLSDTEYKDYLESLAEYFIKKEDVYNASVVSSIRESEYFQKDRAYYSPLNEFTWEKVYKGDMTFLYYLSECKETAFETDAPEVLSLQRKEGRLSGTELSYNTVIKLPEGKRLGKYIWDPCHIAHTYAEDREYIVPGEARKTMNYKCIYCGDNTADTDIKVYSSVRASYIEGEELLFGVRTDEHRYEHYFFTEGKLGEIKVKPCEEGEIVVKINGDIIPRSYEGQRYWGYAFIPMGDEIEISISWYTRK